MNAAPARFACGRCGGPLEGPAEVCGRDGGRAIDPSLDPLAGREDPLLGTLVDDRYQVTGPVYVGGMARVYRAVHLALDRPVALKVMTPSGVLERTRERFLREARAVASLRHPNVVPVHDSGSVDGRPFLVMPFIEGGSLRSWVGAPEPALAPRLQAVADVLAALEAAHGHGLVHRDVKPANVLLDRGGEGVKALLADFGVVLASDDDRLTREHMMVGTPQYMAPEQLDPTRGIEPGPSSDLYGVACVAYALLTGETPHPGESIYEITMRRWRGPDTLTPMRARFELPVGLAAVVERALEPRPSRRWPAARAFREALLPFVDEVRRGSAPRPAVRDPSGATGEIPRSAVGKGWGGPEDAAGPARMELAREMAELAASALARKRGRVVVVAGEAGIGKSWLCRWLLAEVNRDLQARAIVVRASHRAAPLQPIRTALARLAGLDVVTVEAALEGEDPTEVVEPSPDGPGVPSDLAPIASHLADLGVVEQVDPEGAAQLLKPRLGTAAAGLDRPPLGPDALSAWLRAEARIGPVVLLIDDAEQADPGTVEVLRTLARDLEDRPAPMLVLVAVRTPWTHRGADIGPAVLGVDRGAVARVDLGPLDRRSFERLVDAVWPSAPAAVRERVRDRSRGHPLFAASLLRHWSDHPDAPTGVQRRGFAPPGSDDMPPDLARVLLARVDDALGGGTGASVAARDLLVALAVLAPAPVPARLFERYLAALGWGDRAVRDATVDHVVDAGIVLDADRGGDEALVFAHELYRQALLARVAARRRELRRLHRIAAGVWESWATADDPDALTAVFHHLVEAGEVEAAAEAAVRAARVAELLGARARAEEVLRRAVEGLGSARGPLRTVRGRVLLAEAEMAWRWGELAGMRRCASLAAADLQEGDDPAPVVAALRLLGQGSSREGDLSGYTATLRAAADRLEARGHASFAAAVLYEAGALHLGRGGEEEAAPLLRRAAALLSSQLGPEAARASPDELVAWIPAVLV